MSFKHDCNSTTPTKNALKCQKETHYDTSIQSKIQEAHEIIKALETSVTIIEIFKHFNISHCIDYSIFRNNSQMHTMIETCG